MDRNRSAVRRRVAAGALVVSGALAGLLASAPTGVAATASRHPGRALVGKARCAANRAAGPISFVSPFSYDASAGIIDVFAAQQLGYFADLCLDVKIIANSFSANALVSAGTGTITGQGSAADDLALVANGAHFTAISTFGDTSDYALLTRPSITKLTQLEGKTVAYHTTMPIILTEMLKKAGVDLSKVVQVNDTSYNPNLLVAGKFDALQAYRSNEAITLRAEHAAFREYIPSTYGVRGTFNVQVVNSNFLARHRSAIADFLRAELHAFDYCGAHALRCVQIEDAAARSGGVTSDETHNLAEWRFEYALAEHHTLPGAGVGVESYAEWRPEAAALAASGLVRSVPPLAKVEDTTLAASLYHGTVLQWPGS